MTTLVQPTTGFIQVYSSGDYEPVTFGTVGDGGYARIDFPTYFNLVTDSVTIINTPSDTTTVTANLRARCSGGRGHLWWNYWNRFSSRITLADQDIPTDGSWTTISVAFDWDTWYNNSFTYGYDYFLVNPYARGEASPPAAVIDVDAMWWEGLVDVVTPPPIIDLPPVAGNAVRRGRVLTSASQDRYLVTYE